MYVAKRAMLIRGAQLQAGDIVPDAEKLPTFKALCDNGSLEFRAEAGKGSEAPGAGAELPEPALEPEPITVEPKPEPEPESAPELEPPAKQRPKIQPRAKGKRPK
jgi:hypothetical protein